ENPDQPAAFYAEADAPAGSLPHLRQLHGKELSFNNLLDIDAAVFAVSAWATDERTACVIIKHTTPSGVALGSDPEDAYLRTLAADPESAFGGIDTFKRPVIGAAATAIASTFLEAIIDPGYDEHALEVLRAKKNLRLIEFPIAVGTPEELDYMRV